MTDEEYAKFFLKNEYYDIFDDLDKLEAETFWHQVLQELDCILDIS